MLKNLKKRLKDQRGLTLVELLAVIVILGIIAAIAVPSIGNIIAKSKFDAAKADAVQLINAGKLYVATNGNPSSDISFESTSTDSDLEEYVDITDDNLSAWAVNISTTGTVTIDVTFQHPNKENIKLDLDDQTLENINTLKYEDKTTTP